MLPLRLCNLAFGSSKSTQLKDDSLYFQIYPDTGHSLSDVLLHFYHAMEDYLGEKDCFAPLPKESIANKEAGNRNTILNVNNFRVELFFNKMC